MPVHAAAGARSARGKARRGSASSAPPPGLANPDWLPATGAREGAARKAGRGAGAAPPAAGEERGEEGRGGGRGGGGRGEGGGARPAPCKAALFIWAQPQPPWWEARGGRSSPTRELFFEARQRGPGQAGRGARPGPACQTSTSAASPLRRCPCRAPHDGRTPGGQRGMSQEPGPR